MISTPASIPLFAIFASTTPCILFIVALIFHLYRIRTTPLISSTRTTASLRLPNRPTSPLLTHQPNLKPLLLRIIPSGRFRPGKSTLPREFYGLPPRPSGSTKDGKSSKLPSLIGRWGSGTASLPKVTNGGLPAQSVHTEKDLQTETSQMVEQVSTMLPIMSCSGLVALVTGTAYLSTPVHKWNGILFGIAVSVVPWSALSCAIGAVAQSKGYKLPERNSWVLIIIPAMILSIVTGILGVVASGWLVLAGSTFPVIWTTSLVALSSTHGKMSLPSLTTHRIASRFNRLRLPTELASPNSAPDQQRRQKVSDRFFKRDKERSFYSGPALTAHTERRKKKTTKEDDDEGVEVVIGDGTIERDMERSNSWLTSPSRHSNETNNLSPFSYRSDLPTPTTPLTSSTVNTRRSRASTSAQAIADTYTWHTPPVVSSPSGSSASYSTASEGGNAQFGDALTPPERCASRAEGGIERAGSSSRLDSSSSPHQSMWGCDSPSIIRTGNPFDMSFITAPNSVPGKIAYIREKDSSGLRVTGFHIVTPAPPISRMESQYSIGDDGDQSFPHSVSAEDADMPYDLKRSTFERDCSRAPSLDSKRSSLKQPLAEPLPVTVLRRSCSTNRNSFALSDRLQRPVMENLPPLPAGRGDGARSPGASSTIYSPTSAWNKDSTDPLVAHRMHGVSTMTMSSSPLLQAPADEFKTRNASVEDLMMMTDEALREAQEGSILEEVDDMRMRMSGKAAITSLWVCWALSVPSQLPTVHGVAATILFLVALLIHAPLLGGCYLFLRPWLTRDAREAVLPPLKIHPVSRHDISSQPRTSEGLERIAEMPSRSLLSASDSPAQPRWSQLMRPQPSLSQFGFRKSTPTEDIIKDGRSSSPCDFDGERKLMQKRMSKPISDVWIENGQARRHSGRLERIISIMAPQPRLSMLPLEREQVETHQLEEDPETTPRPSRRLPIVNKAAQQAEQSPLRLSSSAPHAKSSVQGDDTYGWIRPSAIESEASLESFEMHHLRRQSAETDPDSKSIKNARVITAIRGKISRSPTFYFADTNEPLPQLEGNTATATGPLASASLPGGLSPPPRETAATPGSRRFSGFSAKPFKGTMKGDELPLRRRTFDFGKLISSKRHERREEPPNSMRFEMDRMSLGLVQGLVPGIKIGRHASINGALFTDPATRAESIFEGVSLCSSFRPSMDIPPFRPSLDLCPSPITHGRSSSVEFAVNGSFDVGEAEQSTPKRNVRRRTGHKSNRSLPVVSPGDLVEEIIEALDEYGKFMETPVRNFAKLQAADMRRKSPAKGILKKPPSPSLANSNMIVELSTHDLPPLPDNLDELLEQHGRSSRACRPSVPVPPIEHSLAEEQTTPKASRTALPFRGDSNASSLSTVAERSGEISSTSPFRPNKMSISTEHMLDIGGPAVPADHEEAIEEMEMMLSMDSPTVESYMASIDGTTSRPVSIDGGDSWLIRRPSKSSLSQLSSDDIRSLATKKSSDTVKTTATTATASSVESMPTPTPMPMHPRRRKSLFLTSLARPISVATEAPSEAPSKRDSLASDSTGCLPTSGLRPLMLLGEVSANAQVTRARLQAGKPPTSDLGVHTDEGVTKLPPSEGIPSQPQPKATRNPALPKGQIRQLPVPATVYPDENDMSGKKTPNMSGRSSRANLTNSGSPKKVAMTMNMR